MPPPLPPRRLPADAKGTNCDQRIERIHGTDHAYILRVPFRRKDGRVGGPWGEGRAGRGAEGRQLGSGRLQAVWGCHLIHRIRRM